MGEVVSLPGVFRPELEEPIEPSQVLRSALERDLVDIVYVARTSDGGLLMGASHTDIDAAIGLLARGIQVLIAGDVPEREL